MGIIQKLCRDEQAASMAEYALVLSLVAAGMLIALVNLDGLVVGFRDVTVDLANVALPKDSY